MIVVVIVVVAVDDDDDDDDVIYRTHRLFFMIDDHSHIPHYKGNLKGMLIILYCKEFAWGGVEIEMNYT